MRQLTLGTPGQLTRVRPARAGSGKHRLVSRLAALTAVTGLAVARTYAPHRKAAR